MHDPVTFRSDQLPTEHFDKRFSPDNLAFWVPLLIEEAQLSHGNDVLDVGCGTGGFTRAIAGRASAHATGYDVSAQFIEYARGLDAPVAGSVDWVVGDAERLAFADGSYDRVLLSLVLHQLGHPLVAVTEAFRVLREGGVVLVRTIAPEDVADRVPERYLPTMASADAARLPTVDAIEGWLAEAGFVLTTSRRILRNKRLILAEEERGLITEARSRYKFITSHELSEGLKLMRADAIEAEGNWIDPRATYIVTATKPVS